MRNCSLVPKPWWQVGLAILPGLIFLSRQVSSTSTPLSTPLSVGLHFLLLAVMILLSASSVVLAAVRRPPFNVPVWGFIPLGLLVDFGLGALVGSVIFSWRSPLAFFLLLMAGFGLLVTLLLVMLKPRLVTRILLVIGGTLALTVVIAALPAFAHYGFESRTLLTLYIEYYLLVVIGVFLAKHSGPSAALFVLAGGLSAMSFHIEQVIYFWDHPFWGDFFNVAETVLFFVLTPIGVLRSRYVWSQAVALLLPICAYFIALVPALSAVRGFSVGRSVSIADPAIVLFTTIGVAIVLYAWVSSQRKPQEELYSMET